MPAITTRFLGFISGGLGVVLALVAAFAWLQTDRLSTAHETIAAQSRAANLMTDRINADAAALAQRDLLIDKQNKAVTAIVNQQAADRKVYLANLDAATVKAGKYQSQASDLLKRTTTATDELGRARAALQLILETVGTEQPSNALRDPRKEP